MPLQPRTISLLRKVQEVIKNPPEGLGFNMDAYKNTQGKDMSKIQHFDCGTTYCIAGWMVMLDDELRERINLDGPGLSPQIARALGEPDRIFTELFLCTTVHDRSMDEITADEALTAINRFIEYGGTQGVWQ